MGGCSTDSIRKVNLNRTSRRAAQFPPHMAPFCDNSSYMYLARQIGPSVLCAECCLCLLLCPWRLELSSSVADQSRVCWRARWSKDWLGMSKPPPFLHHPPIPPPHSPVATPANPLIAACSVDSNRTNRDLDDSVRLVLVRPSEKQRGIRGALKPRGGWTMRLTGQSVAGEDGKTRLVEAEEAKLCVFC